MQIGQCEGWCRTNRGKGWEAPHLDTQTMLVTVARPLCNRQQLPDDSQTLLRDHLENPPPSRDITIVRSLMCIRSRSINLRQVKLTSPQKAYPIARSPTAPMKIMYSMSAAFWLSSKRVATQAQKHHEKANIFDTRI